MKANELMLNDYVLYKGKIARVLKLVAINIIDLSTGIGTNWRPHEDVNPNDVCPVPLTAEILEKNGFESTPALNERIWMRNGQEVWLDNEGRNYCAKIKRDEYYFEGCIEYVHQLQHALRLCGIEHEIKL